MFFFHGRRLAQIERRLALLERHVDIIYEVVVVKQELHKMVAKEFEELRNMISHSTSVQASAVTLLRGLADKLADLADHPSADEIRDLSQDIRQHAGELAAAIAMHQSGGGEEEKEEPEDEEGGAA